MSIQHRTDGRGRTSGNKCIEKQHLQCESILAAHPRHNVKATTNRTPAVTEEIGDGVPSAYICPTSLFRRCLTTAVGAFLFHRFDFRPLPYRSGRSFLSDGDAQIFAAPPTNTGNASIKSTGEPCTLARTARKPLIRLLNQILRLNPI